MLREFQREINSVLAEKGTVTVNELRALLGLEDNPESSAAENKGVIVADVFDDVGNEEQEPVYHPSGLYHGERVAMALLTNAPGNLSIGFIDITEWDSNDETSSNELSPDPDDLETLKVSNPDIEFTDMSASWGLGVPLTKSSINYEGLPSNEQELAITAEHIFPSYLNEGLYSNQNTLSQYLEKRSLAFSNLTNPSSALEETFEDLLEEKEFVDAAEQLGVNIYMSNSNGEDMQLTALMNSDYVTIIGDRDGGSQAISSDIDSSFWNTLASDENFGLQVLPLSSHQGEMFKVVADALAAHHRENPGIIEPPSAEQLGVSGEALSFFRSVENSMMLGNSFGTPLALGAKMTLSTADNLLESTQWLLDQSGDAQMLNDVLTHHADEFIETHGNETYQEALELVKQQLPQAFG